MPRERLGDWTPMGDVVRTKRGELIKRRRLEKGLTQAQLADLAETDQGAISAFESGKRTMAPTSVRLIARALNLTEDEIERGGLSDEELEQLKKVEAERRLTVASTVETKWPRFMGAPSKARAIYDLQKTSAFEGAPPDVRERVARAANTGLDFFELVALLRESLDEYAVNELVAECINATHAALAKLETGETITPIEQVSLAAELRNIERNLRQLHRVVSRGLRPRAYP